MRQTAAFLLFLFIGVVAFGSSLTVTGAQCCYLNDPLGIESPSFGWRLSSGESGAVQTAWELQIASSPESLKRGKADVWQSGKTLSDKQFGIIPDGASFESARTYFWRVRVWDEKGKASSWSLPSRFSTGILRQEDWKAEWITYNWSEDLRMPYLRKEFKVNGKVKKAIAFICGLGVSDLFVNGEYADSTRVLDPAQTNYESYALYSSIDVTGLLTPGENCLGVMLGDGWFNQGTVFADFSYGRPMLRLRLCVDYADGTSEAIVSDDSWEWAQGPVIKANIYSGEIFDARLRIQDWAKSGNPKGDWKRVRMASQSAPPAAYSQPAPPIRTHKTLSARSMWKGEEGQWIYDFGTNNTALIKLKVSLPSGVRIKVQCGEEIYTDSSKVDFRSTGTEVVPVQTDEYVCAGTGSEIWMARFTYHGFRYAQVSFSDPSIVPEPDWVQAVTVHTDLMKKGSFSCSDEQLNRLHEMALRTVEGNILGVPTDCPTREKCGWLGDSHAYIKMACFNYDVDNFIVKYLEDIRSGAAEEDKGTLHHLLRNSVFYQADKASGIPYMIAPGKRLCGVASPDWGTAVPQLPWHLYLYDGNLQALRTYYDFMRQWTDYVTTLSVNHIVYQGLGDWDPPYGNSGMDTPVEFTSTALHYYDVCIMEQAAVILGKTEDKNRYAAEKTSIKSAVIEKFFNPVAKTFGTQTADAMALDLGLCPDGTRKEVGLSLARGLSFHHNFLNTGIFGFSRIASALSRNGQAEAAFKTFTKKGLYSFEWMWKKYGATTMWEVLPVCDDNTSETARCSHCHPMQAGFDVWFYEDIAGIRPVANAPGFKEIHFEPLWDIDLDWAEASVMSRYGEIKSSWKKIGASVEWEIAVPVGASALVAVPKGKEVLVEGRPIDESYVSEYENDEKSFYRMPSGSRTLIVK